MPNNISRVSEESDFFDAKSFESFIDQRMTFAIPRMTTTAFPFSEEDLRAFELAGEHPGLD